MIADVALTDPAVGCTGYLERTMPAALTIGGGVVLPLRGWLHAPAATIARLTLDLGPCAMVLRWWDDLRPDLLETGAEGSSRLFAGFGGLLSLRSGEILPAEAMLRIDWRHGATSEWAVPLPRILPVPDRPAGRPAPLALCLATYQPDPVLLARQIASLRRQTVTDWICLVQDDASDDDRFAELARLTAADRRFTVHRNPQRLGFRDNFAAALARVPRGVDHVAFSDQDDDWRPDKLERTLGALGGADLAFCDARAVDAAGVTLAPSLYAALGSHRPDLDTLLLGNMVTGAASVFRAALLDAGLPLPPIPDLAHDHWIALLAAAGGGIRRVVTALYDYVQHDANAIGFRLADDGWPRLAELLSIRPPPAPADGDDAAVAHAYRLYHAGTTHWRRLLQLGATLALRRPGAGGTSFSRLLARQNDSRRPLLAALARQLAKRGRARELAWMVAGLGFRRRLLRDRAAWTAAIATYEFRTRPST